MNSYFAANGVERRRLKFARLLREGEQISDRLLADAATLRNRIAEIDRLYPEAHGEVT